MKNLRSSGQAGRVTYQLGEMIKSGIKSGQVGQADAVLQSLQCIPLQDIPSTFEAESIYQLPQTSSQFDAMWGGATVNPLNILQADSSLGVVEATSDFGNANQLAADFCLMGIGVTIEGENENLVIPGVLAPSNSPDTISPDDLLQSDVGSADAPGLHPNLIPAIVDWGTYSRRLAEDLADALQVQFIIAERLVVIDEPLTTIASCGTRQGGMGFSRSDMDTAWFAEQVNNSYAALGTSNPINGFTFVPQNVRRNGLDGTAASETLSVFEPDRLSGQIAKVSYNEGRRHPIYTNDCTRIFDKPIMIKAGRPFQFQFTTRSKTFLGQAVADATWDFGGRQVAAAVAAGAGDPTGGFFSGRTAAFEAWNSREAVPQHRLVTMPLNVFTLKGGLLKVKVCFLGILLYEQALCDAFNAVCSKYGDSCMLQP